MVQRYQYQPLSGQGPIRLLRLDRNGERISGSLVTTSLADAPHFYALSYCWGKGGKRSTLHVQGNKIPITSNLAATLQVLRGLDHLAVGLSRPLEYLWVDQICINQDDTGERNQQVSQMGAIYRKSVRTLIWLGEDRGFAKEGFEVMKRIESIYLQEFPSASQMVSREQDQNYNKSTHSRLGLPDYMSHEWRALLSIMNFPWFHRIWVVQETVLSSGDPIVFCGSHTCPWARIVRTCRWLYSKRHSTTFEASKHPTEPRLLGTTRAVAIFDLAAGYMHFWSLVDLVVNCRGNFQATNPRDQVYGLMGIVETVERENYALPVKIEYHKSTADVYKDFVRHSIDLSGSLGVLSLSLAYDPRIKHSHRIPLPGGRLDSKCSWIPDLTFSNPIQSLEAYDIPFIQPSHGEEPQHLRSNIHTSGASESQRAQTSLARSCGNILSLQGLMVDRVVSSLDAAGSIAQQETRLSHWSLRDILSSVYMNILAVASGSYRRRAVRGSLHRPWLLRAWEEIAERGTYASVDNALWALLHSITGGHIDGKSLDQDTMSSLVMHLSRLLQSKWAKRKVSAALAKANEELLKYPQQSIYPASYPDYYERVGTSGLRKGNAVCVLFGGDFPFILRKREDAWLFIGDCYVHEYMDGEAMQEMRAGRLKEETFDLC